MDYARCSTDKQDLAAQRAAIEGLGVAPNRIYTDHGLSGANRALPGLDQALAAVRAGDTLVVPKLDPLSPLGSRRSRHRRRASPSWEVSIFHHVSSAFILKPPIIYFLSRAACWS